MTTQNRDTLKDLFKLGEAALSALLGAGQELGTMAQNHRENLVRKLDLVTREEFDAAFAMIKKARTMQDDLDRRLKKLEQKKPLSSPRKTPKKKQVVTKK